MIKVEILDEILEMHAKYILNSEMKNRIESIKKIEELENININLDEIFINQHKNFCDYIIENINELKEIKSKSINSNIFLSKPKELNDIIKKVNSNFPLISEKMKNEERNIPEGKKSYSKIILDAIGYERFSKGKIDVYLNDEKIIFDNYNNKKIRERLKNYKKVDNDSRYNKFHYKRLLEETKQHICNVNNFNCKFSEVYNIVSYKIDNFDNLDISKYTLENIINDFKIILDKIVDIKSTGRVINIYNYKNIENEAKDAFEWNAYHFVLNLGLKVCPYCNRQYITPIYSENSKVRADLDHFFPKSKYPYLSMSIYNLVPSCKFCNSSLKGDKEFTYENNINPYEYAIKDYLKFSYYPETVDSFCGNDEVEIVLNKKHQDENIVKKCCNNIDVFQIKELYQYHSDIVSQILKKRAIYDDVYIEYIYNKYKNIFKSKEDVIDTIFKNISSDDFDNPLSILIEDIMQELEIK